MDPYLGQLTPFLVAFSRADRPPRGRELTYIHTYKAEWVGFCSSNLHVLFPFLFLELSFYDRLQEKKGKKRESSSRLFPGFDLKKN